MPAMISCAIQSARYSPSQRSGGRYRSKFDPTRFGACSTSDRPNLSQRTVDFANVKRAPISSQKGKAIRNAKL
jgi:hypothetical protein